MTSKSKCVNCNRNIWSDRDKYTLEGSDYHKECLKCAVCGTVVKFGSQYVEEGKLKCPKHVKSAVPVQKEVKKIIPDPEPVIRKQYDQKATGVHTLNRTVLQESIKHHEENPFTVGPTQRRYCQKHNHNVKPCNKCKKEECKWCVINVFDNVVADQEWWTLPGICNGCHSIHHCRACLDATNGQLIGGYSPCSYPCARGDTYPED